MASRGAQRTASPRRNFAQRESRHLADCERERPCHPHHARGAAAAGERDGEIWFALAQQLFVVDGLELRL